MVRNLSKSEIKKMLDRGVWRQECPVHYSRLKVIEVSYVGFDDSIKIGSLVILDILSEKVNELFRKLLDVKFPIQKIVPIEEFEGDDVKSMKANNSSAFNGRLVARTNRWSSHAFGAAIDINPIQNPYLLLNEQRELIEVIPPEGNNFLDRSDQKKGMVEEIVPIFAEFGFTEWGGNWKEKPDYHHFQVPWDEIKMLLPNIEF